MQPRTVHLMKNTVKSMINKLTFQFEYLFQHQEAWLVFLLQENVPWCIFQRKMKTKMNLKIQSKLLFSPFNCSCCSCSVCLICMLYYYLSMYGGRIQKFVINIITNKCCMFELLFQFSNTFFVEFHLYLFYECIGDDHVYLRFYSNIQDLKFN